MKINIKIKKIVLSLFVIVTFLVYSLSQRLSGAKINNLALPNIANNSLTIPGGQPSTTFKDGSYTGNVADAYYGNVQVKAIIKNGKIADIQFLDYPHDRQTSVMINSQATPMLRTEAIQVQSASVDIISGATQTSLAFRESLQSALNKAF